MKKSNIIALKMNDYVRPNPHSLVVQQGKYFTNGPDNEYFFTVEKAYLGSPTNQAIIDNYSNYILGEGLEDKTGLIDIEQYLSEEDQRLAFTDYKMQGACAFQVTYNVGGTIAKFYYLPTKTLGIDRMQDVTEEPEAYWYSFDWCQKTKFKPEKFPAFGFGDRTKTEILYIKRHSPQPLFSLPDWQSGIQYCQTEEELSNYYISHIKNNFSAGKLINVNDGIPETDDALEEAKNAVKKQLTGTSNAGTVIISFNANKENATTIENIEITDAYAQFKFLSEECIEKIMLSHKVNDKALFGFNNASGFSSTAEQLIQSMKILYRSQINPIRRTLIKGLEKAFKLINSNCELSFKDFPELAVDNIQPITQQVKQANTRISFDFDGTANTDKGKKMIDDLVSTIGTDVYIISARHDNSGLLEFAKAHKIPVINVFATGSNKNKIQKIKDLGITIHYDNNQDVVDALPGIGINIDK